MPRSDADERRLRFESLALPFMGALFNTALRLTREPQDAADLTQETFLRAYRTFDTLLPTLTPEFLATPRTFSRRGRTASLPPWAVLRHVVNHTTYHRGQVASKLKRFGVQQPDTDLVYYALEQVPQPK